MRALKRKRPDALIHHSPKNKVPIVNAISKYLNHSSMKTTLTNCKNHFFFKIALLDDVEIEFLRLEINKASHALDILTKVSKENVDLFSAFLLNFSNISINSSNSPWAEKSADGTPVYKKDSDYQTTNHSIYRKSLKTYYPTKWHDTVKFFSKYQTGFWIGFDLQICLVVMIEKFRNSLDQRIEYAALLMYLSKAFDCLPHDMINANTLNVSICNH